MIRALDSLRVQGRLSAGVSMKSLRYGAEGKLRIVSSGDAGSKYWKILESFGWDADKADNRILVRSAAAGGIE